MRRRKGPWSQLALPGFEAPPAPAPGAPLRLVAPAPRHRWNAGRCERCGCVRRRTAIRFAGGIACGVLVYVVEGADGRPVEHLSAPPCRVPA